MSEKDSVFELGLGRNRVPDEQIEHPGSERMRRLPKRFYEYAEAAPAENGFSVLLDGKGVKTPARAPLVVPSQLLAEAMAEEWNRQRTYIDPRSMWLNKLANTAIDRVVPRMQPLIEEIVVFATSDLLCYRADRPTELIGRQVRAWDPLLDWVSERFDAKLRVTTGIVHIAQDDAELAKLKAVVGALGAFHLTGLHNAVTLTSSCVLGLALLYGRLDAAAAFEIAHIDESWQAELCGNDEDEAARLVARRAELVETMRYMQLVGDVTSGSVV